LVIHTPAIAGSLCQATIVPGAVIRKWWKSAETQAGQEIMLCRFVRNRAIAARRGIRFPAPSRIL
jgi:hypothetical protein